MKYEYLRTFAHNGMVEIPEAQLRTTGTDLNLEKGFDITKMEKKDQSSRPVLTFSRMINGPGLWVPYLAQKNIFAYVSNYHFWAASGPFSGCVFEVGEMNGRKYVAHLSREGKNDRNIGEWENLGGRRVLFTKRIMFTEPMMHFREDKKNQGGAVASIAIANLNEPITVTQFDVRTNTADGMSGRIMSVQKLESD